MRRLALALVAVAVLAAVSQPASAAARLKLGWFESDASGLDGDLAYGAELDVPLARLTLSLEHTRSSVSGATAKAWHLGVGKRFGVGALGFGVYWGGDIALTDWEHSATVSGVFTAGDGTDFSAAAVLGLRARGYSVEAKYRLGDIPKAEQGLTLWLAIEL